MGSRFLLQIGLIIAAVIAAIVILWPGAAEEPPSDKTYSMLHYLDQRVGVQEDERDVRCWSSFNKLQMFITECEISEDAKSVRIEEHMRLIQSLWEAADDKQQDGEYLQAATVEEVVSEKYPHVDTADGVQFDLGDTQPVLVVADAIRDYSDTIEPWRLLQTWVTRQLDKEGNLKLSRQFNEEALQVLYRFLRAYDLAVLQHARNIAQ